MDPWLLLPRILLFLGTLRRDTVGSESVAAVCSGFCARSWVFVAETAKGLLANTGLFLSTGDRYLFLLQRTPDNPFRLFITAFSHACRQSFVIEVSDLYSSSPLFSTFDSWEPTSSDESPCRTIPTRFWVDQTHVFLISTDFPRYDRTEFLTSIIELRHILMLSSRRVTEKKSA